MNKCFWRRLATLAGVTILLAGCGNKATKDALDKAQTLSNQKQYQEANQALLDALHAREAQVRTGIPTPTDQASSDAALHKVLSDSEILKMERAQIPLYLHLDRADPGLGHLFRHPHRQPGGPGRLRCLSDKDTIIRQGAVRMLGLAQKPSVADPQAIAALAAAAKDPDQDVRRAAVSALGAIKDPRATAPLIAALKDSYWFVRSEAANSLGQEKDPLAIKPLLDTLGDSDATVEDSAETALLLLCRMPGVQTNDFASRLDDSNPKVVLISAMCLGLMKDPRSIPVLEHLVTSTDATTRLDALKALGETGDPSVVPILRQTLKDPDVNMRGWSIIGWAT